jgi:DAK2 domain fusion protein YloV
VTVLQQLAPGDLRRIVSTYRDVLRTHQDELNALNVYPVPDGDTGTNMALTLESVVGELAAAPDGAAMGQVCEAIRHGSLMGARGNSGVILSQILRGLADTFSPLEVVTAADLATGLRRAADAAYAAVLRPVEGTILTLVRVAAESAESSQPAESAHGDLAAMLDRTAAAARDAVASTPDLLPALREAGVVDAGGRGFELLLAACLHVVEGRPLPDVSEVHRRVAVTAHGNEGVATGSDDLRYEVMYFLESPDDRIDGFKKSWGALGDSIVVVGGDGLWNCHVHTADIGAAIEAGIAVGRPRDIRVTDLFEQVHDLDATHHEPGWVRDRTSGAPPPAAALEPVTTAVVAVAVGAGIDDLLRRLGVQRVVAGGQSMNPSTADLLEAVDACAADGVIVLPNNKNIVPVAEQVPDLTGRPVAIVPTVAVVEALGALVAYDPDATLEVNREAMAEAADRVRAGEVTQAVRDSAAPFGPIASGDWMAITRDGIMAALGSAHDAAVAVVDALVDDDAELVTIIVGADADPDDVARVGDHVADAHPHVEVEVHQGGQPLYPYLIGVE